MRLEDYQKWLDSQFVDTAPVAEEPARSVVAPPRQALAVEVVQPQPEIPAAPPVAERPLASAAASPTAPAPSDAVIDLPVAPDDEVPSIERYLPFLRGKAPDAPQPDTEIADATTAESPAAPTDTAAEQPADDDVSPPKPEAEEPVVAAPAPAADGVLHLVEEVPAPKPTAPVKAVRSPEAAAVVAEPAPKRARQYARTVRGGDAVPPMEAAELWELVPRHLQALVAMGGDDEVAQNSYTRQFRESRLDLVSRLLDPTLSLEETARLLNVCPATVRRYTNRGLLTHQRTAGDQRRFKLSDVLAFLEAQARVRQQQLPG
jgi:excisionase family DNA binding protein